MRRSKEELVVCLKEQFEFLWSSLAIFYGGNLAESVRIAGVLRTLVHETGQSKSLLLQIRPNALDLQILETRTEEGSAQDVFFSFAVSVRVDSEPEPSVSSAVDLESSHYRLSSLGAWWNRPVFTFVADGKQLVYTREKLIRTLADKEGGAHVDPKKDSDYVRLLSHPPLNFEVAGVAVKPFDMARFLAAQSGVEMLECLRGNFFHDIEVSSKWECGTPRLPALYFDQISAVRVKLPPSGVPNPRIHITRRGPPLP